MSLLVHEGFDHYNVLADVEARSGFLQWNSGFVVSVSNVNRTGIGKSLLFGQNATLRATLSSNLGEIIVGFGIMFTSGIFTSSGFMMTFTDAGSEQCHVLFEGSLGRARLIRGSTVLWTSDQNIFPANAWVFFELKLTIDNTGGAFAFRINGQPIISLTGLDTQQTANAYTNGFDIGANTAPTGWVTNVDDLYINNNAADPGSYPMNDFAGDLRCYTLYAIGNNSVQWTPLANANWQEISEVSFDGDTTYNSSDTAGQEDTFNYQPLALTITDIIAVQVTGAYRKTVAGLPILQQAMISGVTEVYGASISVPNGYAFFTDIFKVDPNTSANWTSVAVNSIKVGYKLISV